MSISFADAGSTSGWLIPHHWFKTQGIDPRSYFRYRDGASHAANAIAVATGQVDLATDYDRNLAAMIAAGRLREDQVKVVWRSDPLPNDALAARDRLDPGLKSALRDAALGIDAASACPGHARQLHRLGRGAARQLCDDRGRRPRPRPHRRR
jgi:phosphonate transport system substrate-binding protein